MIMTVASYSVSRVSVEAVKGWHQSDSLRHTPEIQTCPLVGHSPEIYSSLILS